MAVVVRSLTVGSVSAWNPTTSMPTARDASAKYTIAPGTQGPADCGARRPAAVRLHDALGPRPRGHDHGANDVPAPLRSQCIDPPTSRDAPSVESGDSVVEPRLVSGKCRWNGQWKEPDEHWQTACTAGPSVRRKGGARESSCPGWPVHFLDCSRRHRAVHESGHTETVRRLFTDRWHALVAELTAA